MAPHPSVLAWNISWTGEPGGLQSTGSQESGMPEQSIAQLKKQKQCYASQISDFSQIRTAYFSVRWVCAPPCIAPCRLCAPKGDEAQETKQLACFFPFEG